MNEFRFWKIVSNVSVTVCIALILLLRFFIPDEYKKSAFGVIAVLGVLAVILLFVSEWKKYRIKKKK